MRPDDHTSRRGWPAVLLAAVLVLLLPLLAGTSAASPLTPLAPPTPSASPAQPGEVLPDGYVPPGMRAVRKEGEARIFTGKGLDTCHTPSLATMRAWTESPYRAIGVYLGGRARACPDQPNLTRAWTREVAALGWYLLPLYVGSQSPCVHADRKRPYTIDAADPRGAGAAEGSDAVERARALGLAPGSPLYLDMEAYDIEDASCARTTLRFVQSWNRAVRAEGYLPGYYSSAGSGVTHLSQARIAGERDLPEAVWFARWNTPPSVEDEPAIAPGAWTPHRRIHQYAGNVVETWGGVRLQIDRNMVDAPVAVLE